MSADGTVSKSGSARLLRYERYYEHPVERVWAALTEPSELSGWLADADVELADGGALELRWLNTDDEGNRAIMNATITALDPPRLLEYDGAPHGRLRWELRPEGDGCTLTLTVAVEAPDDQIPLALAGWHIHLDHLADALAGRPIEWERWNAEHRPHWEELHDRYVAAS